MATLLSVRRSSSDGSLNVVDKTVKNKQQYKSKENPDKGELISESRVLEKQTKYAKQATKGKGRPMNVHGYGDVFLEPNHVKASAFLYEITERTNQLAQPRARATEEKSFRQYLNSSQTSEPSPRIIELSRPRMIYQQPSKPVGYVSPGALTAVATQRIIELSRPKKKRRVKVPKRKKPNYADRNSRKSLKLCKGKSRCHVKHTKKVYDHEYESFLQSKTNRRIKGNRVAGRKQYPPKFTSSNRTIIMVDLSPKTNSRFKLKKTHGLRHV